MPAGKVFLVGAGPGDPELMTLKAARALAAADVVLVDDLVNRGCLAHVRFDARIIEVGKRAGCHSTPQAFIEKLLLLHAGRGQTVVRLKGGDPFVFGRGGEELQALAAAGVTVEVIPGVTAGIGAAASLGIPLTQRDLARGVTLVTGHTRDGSEPDWAALAAGGTTLVIYMGLSRLEGILRGLMDAGMAADTPACVVENATLHEERTVFAPLSRIGLLAGEKDMKSPAIVIVGAVVGLSGRNLQSHSRKAA